MTWTRADPGLHGQESPRACETHSFLGADLGQAHNFLGAELGKAHRFLGADLGGIFKYAVEHESLPLDYQRQKQAYSGHCHGHPWPFLVEPHSEA